MAINLDHVTEQITVTDTAANASLTVNPKGTGAFNVAAGSGGLNLSNGGTVTVITRTALGSYTSNPTLAISAPTTAGGVQATANAIVQNTGATIAGGGTGYTVGDTISMVGGTLQAGLVGTFTVATVSGGVITAVNNPSFSQYSTTPTNPVSVTGGTGSGATLNVTYIYGYPVITNAGSGYVEQPTITFSGGGGSGAAAYATVGGTTTIKGIGYGTNNSTIKFVGPSGVNQLELWDVPASDSWVAVQNTQYGRAQFVAQGNANAQLWFSANGSGFHNFSTNGTSLVTQARIAHTASAVNYVNITGATTGNDASISALGSDSNIWLRLDGKGNRGVAIGYFARIGRSFANYFEATGNNASSSPILSVGGSDTNIDINLTTKGTGSHKFNTGNGEMVRVADSSGTGFVQLSGGTTPYIVAQGSTNANLSLGSNGTGTIFVRTNGGGTTQAAVTHTASAVNYLQVTGASTGNDPTLSVQGSDTNINFAFVSKGSSVYTFASQGGSNRQFRIDGASASVNYLNVSGSGTGSAPVLSALGSDTNIDLAFTPKGTGNVRFGTYTGTILTPTGYVEIKDSGGTVRRLLVG